MPPFLQVLNGHGAGAHFNGSCRGSWREQTHRPENRVAPAVLVGRGCPRSLRQAEMFPVFVFCPCLGIIFAIISNPVMNISMQRTFLFLSDYFPRN